MVGAGGKRRLRRPIYLPDLQEGSVYLYYAIQAQREQIEGFGLVRAWPDQTNEGLAIALEFSQPLVGTQDFDKLVTFAETIAARLSARDAFAGSLIIARGSKVLDGSVAGVKASHGGTVGELDPEQIFYMMTRGIPRAEAVRVLVEGYFEEVVQRLEDDAARSGRRDAVIGERRSAVLRGFGANEVPVCRFCCGHFLSPRVPRLRSDATARKPATSTSNRFVTDARCGSATRR